MNGLLDFETMIADVYTVEPGYQECDRYLRRGIGGGIGALEPILTKYYSFTRLYTSEVNENVSSPSQAQFGPNLGDFLCLMDYVDEDVRFYCTTSKSKVRDYVRAYLEYYLTPGQADEIKWIINSYLKQHNHFESGYKENIVIGTPFFNDLFYATAWKVAECFFAQGEIDSLSQSFLRIPGNRPGRPRYRQFVSYLDSCREAYFQFDVFGDQCYLDKNVTVVSKVFHCSRDQYERSFRPYILFLSNWTLVLATYLCMRSFGQCAFGIYWETGGLALSQEMQRRNWLSSRR